MEEKYCILSRVRIARNIKGFPFSDKMNESEMLAVCDAVRGALGNEYSYINFSALSETKKRSYVERHLVSPQFAASQNKTALFLNRDRSVSIMVGEEDHIRIQAFGEGLMLEYAYEKATEAEKLIGRSVEYMFDDKFGYLTKCPTNLGTGMRVSVMMFLPLTVNKDSISPISSDLARNGMTIRGVYGEGSNALSALYQISNNVTLGISEKETVDLVFEVAKSLSKVEERNENKYLKENTDYVTDTSMRALGVLRSAYMISSAEASGCITKVMLGNNLKIYNLGKQNTEIFHIFESSLPANITENAESYPKNDRERDIFRAKYLREQFK